MAFQTQSNGYIAYKAQSGKGTPASGSGGKVLRATGGKGKMSKGTISSNEVRQDGMRSRGRHGSAKTSGSYPGELSFGSFDDIFEAVTRGTWTSGASITQATASLSSATISVSGSAVTFSAGNVITAGARVGDVHVWTAGLAAGDLNKPLRVTGATSTSVTYGSTLTTVAGPVSTYAFSVKGRKVMNAAAGALQARYFTIEEHELDIDGSEVFSDCKWGSIRIAMSPNGNIAITPGWTGTGAMTTATGASAPVFSSPTNTTSVPLAGVDAVLRLGTGDVVDLTSFDLTIDLGLSAPDVVTSGTPGTPPVSPDVFEGQMSVSGSMTVMRSDLQRVTDFINESQLSLHLVAQVPGSSPIDFISLFVGNFTLGDVDKSELKKEGGARTQTLQIPADLVGKDERGGAYDPCMIKFQVSQ